MRPRSRSQGEEAGGAVHGVVREVAHEEGDHAVYLPFRVLVVQACQVGRVVQVHRDQELERPEDPWVYEGSVIRSPRQSNKTRLTVPDWPSAQTQTLVPRQTVRRHSQTCDRGWKARRYRCRP